MTAVDGSVVAASTLVDVATAVNAAEGSTAVGIDATAGVDAAAGITTAAGIDAAMLLFVTAAVTAVVGAFVAWLAHRGYRRNGSEAMRFLAVGVVCFTVVPFLVTYGAGPAVGASDAATLLGVLVANVAGLLAVLYSLEGT